MGMSGAYCRTVHGRPISEIYKMININFEKYGATIMGWCTHYLESFQGEPKLHNVYQGK